VARRLELHGRRRRLLHQAPAGADLELRVYGNAVGEPRKIDDFTVELTTRCPTR